MNLLPRAPLYPRFSSGRARKRELGLTRANQVSLWLRNLKQDKCADTYSVCTVQYAFSRSRAALLARAAAIFVQRARLQASADLFGRRDARLLRRSCAGSRRVFFWSLCGHLECKVGSAGSKIRPARHYRFLAGGSPRCFSTRKRGERKVWVAESFAGELPRRRGRLSCFPWAFRGTASSGSFASACFPSASEPFADLRRRVGSLVARPPYGISARAATASIVTPTVRLLAQHVHNRPCERRAGVHRRRKLAVHSTGDWCVDPGPRRSCRPSLSPRARLLTHFS